MTTMKVYIVKDLVSGKYVAIDMGQVFGKFKITPHLIENILFCKIFDSVFEARFCAEDLCLDSYEIQQFELVKTNKTFK